ncbi:MAG: Rieske (2Fe-2S) protein [Planctomycetota bacterium]|nr:Rieske (2Fe-2S) protein [Planctomycetota bacterium]
MITPAKPAAELLRVCTLDELKTGGVKVVQGRDRPIAVYAEGGKVLAVDNRCPHLGFPLSRGSVKDGILTCHWHQARFDLCSGCTFDLWADDVPRYATEVREGVVFVAREPAQREDVPHLLRRLEKGMQQNISLIQGKSLLGLLRHDYGVRDLLREVARFANRFENRTGLVELAIAGRMFPVLSEETAYFTLLRAVRVAATSANGPIQTLREPLEGAEYPFETLKNWLRQWSLGRHRDGAERVVRTAIAQGASPEQLTDLLVGVETDRIYSAQGHTLDAVNKAFELLDLIGWEHAMDVLPLTARSIVQARGADEAAEWYHPIRLLEPLREAEAALPKLLEAPRAKAWQGAAALRPILLGDDPLRLLGALTQALGEGAEPALLAKEVAYVCALRLARFSANNEIGDWFNPQHTFNYANAVHQAIQRNPTPDVVRGLLHAALSVYHDRFLNIPPTALPGEREKLDALPKDPAELRAKLLEELDQRSSVHAAARLAARYVRLGHPPEPLFDTLAFATVRESLDFHTLQVLEDGFTQCREWGNAGPEVEHILVGVVRDLAAFCPTSRAQHHTATIALRLYRGEKLYEEDCADHE